MSPDAPAPTSDCRVKDRTGSALLGPLELTGRARTHVVQLLQPRCALHHNAVEPFLALREAAARDGIDIAVFSAFRDFAAQAAIWNRKFAGQRPLYDREGNPLECDVLSEEALIEAIRPRRPRIFRRYVLNVAPAPGDA